MTTDPIVILTALDLEYSAIREYLTGLRTRHHRAGTRFEVGKLSDGHCSIALALAGKGNHPAAVIAERAIAEFSPRALVFVGVAGALWPGIDLGDVIVATHVYGYHGGTSEDDGLKARPRVWEASHECDQLARHVARAGRWTRRLPAHVARPQVRFGPIAAGEIVQDSTISEHARWIRHTYNDALAIEMEAAGVAQAGHLNRSLPVIVIRGISDRADGTKTTTDGADRQPTAAANAAAFAAELATELVRLPPSGQAAGATGRAETMQPIRNVAKHSRVGVQVGQVHGNVTVGAPPLVEKDLLTQVVELRDRLRRARAAGELDSPTCDAADRELAVVLESLRQGDPQATSRTMVALKSLRGLIADVADIAATVTGIIAAVQGLS